MTPSRTATITDVARRAGVGIGTVSRVLNESPHVSDATRVHVLAAIEELGYVRTRGRTAASKPRGQIGLLVPFFDQPATYQRIAALVHRLRPHGYDIVLIDVDTPRRAQEAIHELPRHPHLAGLIIMSLPLSAEEGERLATAKFPSVAVDTSHPALSSLLIDDFNGGRLAASYVISLGHQRIGFLGESRRNWFGFTSSAKREDGFRKALAAASIEPQRGYMRHGPHRRQAAKHLGAELLKLPDRPTAIVAGSDVQAIGVLDAARELGIAVPADLSVIGYDDIDLAAHLDISTVRQPLARSGERAADMLLDALANPHDRQVRVEVLEVEVIARGTTSPVRSPSR